MAGNLLIRIGSGRNNFMRDGESNMLIRLFIFRNGESESSDSFKVNGKFTEKGLENMHRTLSLINDGLMDYFSEIGETNFAPNGVHVYLNRKDKFFSALFRYKLKKYKDVKIADARYDIMYYCFKHSPEVRIFLISNYDVHLANGLWDVDHSNEGPILELSGANCIEYFEGLKSLRQTPNERTSGRYRGNDEGGEE